MHVLAIQASIYISGRPITCNGRLGRAGLSLLQLSTLPLTQRYRIVLQSFQQSSHDNLFLAMTNPEKIRCFLMDVTAMVSSLDMASSCLLRRPQPLVSLPRDKVCLTYWPVKKALCISIACGWDPTNLARWFGRSLLCALVCQLESLLHPVMTTAGSS